LVANIVQHFSWNARRARETERRRSAIEEPDARVERFQAEAKDRIGPCEKRKPASKNPAKKIQPRRPTAKKADAHVFEERQRGTGQVVR
jgi:hypothetical protein